MLITPCYISNSTHPLTSANAKHDTNSNRATKPWQQSLHHLAEVDNPSAPSWSPFVKTTINNHVDDVTTNTCRARIALSRVILLFKHLQGLASLLLSAVANTDSNLKAAGVMAARRSCFNIYIHTLKKHPDHYNEECFIIWMSPEPLQYTSDYQRLPPVRKVRCYFPSRDRTLILSWHPCDVVKKIIYHCYSILISKTIKQLSYKS